jgi:superfamily II DNA/RNA helicase
MIPHMRSKLSKGASALATAHDWRTTDADEIERRRERARTETFAISNLDRGHPVHSNFRVQSGSGLVYCVEIRDLAGHRNGCNCVDFRINGLGTCKHIEAVLIYLEARFKNTFRNAQKTGSSRIDVIPDAARNTLRIETVPARLPGALAEWFDAEGILQGAPEAEAVEQLSRLNLPQLRLSQEIAPWLAARRQAEERKLLRREYELRVQKGEWPAQETKVSLFPYQREGMLHLAFTERALLADEMGLGKTIQAIAACALLRRLGQAARVLVVTPASLKTEWEEQIQRFTTLPCQLVFGARQSRLKHYAQPVFFTLVNYEQMLADVLDVNEVFKPDVIILDEAQRIKNWDTKTARAVKRLRSRYAFVLTGTPIENRIDELHSLMDFLDPSVLGPLFRFNRDFYELDDRGRPKAYRNLGLLHTRIKPYLLRRRKAEVETELPARTDKNHFVALSEEQQTRYQEHSDKISRLMHAAQRRPLTQQEQEKLMRELAMARMVCDTNYILDPEQRACPKLAELETILETCCSDSQVKVIVFSEWERMLELVRGLCQKLDLGFAWHTGSVPQRRRRAEINAFKHDPACRIFLSTESGGTGLNLQEASYVINCDLPWNPAKLEQRIARAWRKNQTRPVTVVNLVSENTIEHRMLDTLATKQALADGVLDLKGELDRIPLAGGRQAFLKKLELLLGAKPTAETPKEAKKALPSDRALGFCLEAAKRLGSTLVRCEERFPVQGAHSVLFLVVSRDASVYQEQLSSLRAEYFGPGATDPLAPVRLEVIDQATDAILTRLQESGVIASATRATRALFPAGEATQTPLSSAEKQRVENWRRQAARKLKIGRLLADGDMLEEARGALSEAIHALVRALAVEQRLPEPEELSETSLAPLAGALGGHAKVLRDFLASDSAPWMPVVETLKTFGL